MEPFIIVTKITTGEKVQITRKMLKAIDPHPSGTTVIETVDGSFMVREAFDVVDKMIDAKLM